VHILLTLTHLRLYASCLSLRVGEVLQKRICSGKKNRVFAAAASAWVWFLGMVLQTGRFKCELTTFFKHPKLQARCFSIRAVEGLQKMI
jgi:hypothetical protein